MAVLFINSWQRCYKVFRSKDCSKAVKNDEKVMLRVLQYGRYQTK